MESGGGGGSRRHWTEERSDSSNLRELLRTREDGNGGNGGNSFSGLTLGAVLSEKRPGPVLAPVQSNRTLLEIIRDDSTGGGGRDSKKSWRTFKDKLRLRRAGAAWTSTVAIPASDVPIQQMNGNSRIMTRRHSTRFPAMGGVSNSDESNPESRQIARPDLSSVPSNRAMLLRRNTSRIPERVGSRLNVTIDTDLPEEHQQPPSAEDAAAAHTEEASAEDASAAHTEEGMGETAEAAPEEGGEGQPHVRMSLMALLAETDRQMGLDASAYMMDDEDEEEEEVEEAGGGGGGGGGEYNNCCVCMVRHKGAAFIPCGHTFCRLCSRELWVQRGNCPLCNNFILEILDIF
ncbi:hypothetical protein RJ640_025425 [Escallonia rubra]|uniref:RING-type domain-containing protein n=1 Tax=Escallonia rubra TaxID=112253 RepID=A0AA88UV42_9ASTE|nr:hypothetical protein RJ640_025425 [Escallonia rubra]